MLIPLDIPRCQGVSCQLMTAVNPQTTVRVPPDLLERGKIEAAKSKVKLNDLWIRGLELAIKEARVKRLESAA